MSGAKSQSDTADRETTVTLGTKVDPEKFAQFQEAAEANDHSKSSQLRELVEIFLDVHEAD